MEAVDNFSYCQISVKYTRNRPDRAYLPELFCYVTGNRNKETVLTSINRGSR
ncbi:hypothetical protein J32TS6_12420 [Virgibacillus pantothenticus]|nr:hypothetical protein J32TS6_12420 [Virgibacillus pantothenticus]